MAIPLSQQWPYSEIAVTVDGWRAQYGARAHTDAQGVQWIITDIEGWFEGLQVRASPIARPMADGDYDGPATFGGRQITISGQMRAPTRGQLMAAMDTIGTLLGGVNRVGRLTVDEAARGLVRTCAVRLNDVTKVQPYGPADPRRGVWSIVLYSPDPNRYGAVAKTASTSRFQPGGGRTYNLIPPRVYGVNGSPGTVSITNVGSRVTWPVLSIAGPVVNPSVRVIGGASITALMTVAAGQTLVIDTGARTVLLDGVTRRHFLSTDSQWFSAPPGQTDLLYTADAGAGQLTAQWRDAW